MLNRVSIGSGPMASMVEGPVAIRASELMGCIGAARLKLGSMSNIVRERSYMMWKPIIFVNENFVSKLKV